jgi:hypothetical protein
VSSEEQAQWHRFMSQRHSLKSARMVGDQLRYVADSQGEGAALLGWAAAAYHLRGRDGWVGWDENHAGRCDRPGFAA